MGREEIVKMTKRYLLKPPIVILVLINRKYGAPFLRAVLSVLYKNSGLVPNDVAMVSNPGNEWGRYTYTNADDQPPYEKRWYELLT